MCTNFTPTRKAEWAKATLGVDLPVGYPDECYPGYTAPLVVKDNQDADIMLAQTVATAAAARARTFALVDAFLTDVAAVTTPPVRTSSKGMSPIAVSSLSWSAGPRLPKAK